MTHFEFTLPVSVVVGAAWAIPGGAFNSARPAAGGCAYRAAPAACPGLPVVKAKADGYGGWVIDEVRKVRACEYTYATRDGGSGTQTVVIFFADKDRAGWAYFFNAKAEPWARCAVPGNPKYDPKAMYWEALKPDGKGYEPFKDAAGKPQPAGYCPAPKDGTNPIPLLPLPPK